MAHSAGPSRDDVRFALQANQRPATLMAQTGVRLVESFIAEIVWSYSGSPALRNPSM
jgi:hypothetical protein